MALTNNVEQPNKPNWEYYLKQADEQIEVLTEHLEALQSEVNDLTGSAKTRMKIEILETRNTLKSQQHYKESIMKDREQQERFQQEKERYVLENSKDILKRANDKSVEKRANYEAIKKVRSQLGKPGFEHGDPNWIDAVFQISEYLRQ